MKKNILIGLILLASRNLWAIGDDPFHVAATLEKKETNSLVHVSFEIPAQHFLYAESIKITAKEPFVLAPDQVPAPLKILDKYTSEDKEVYETNFDAFYRIEKTGEGGLDVQVEYQGCNDSVCFFPQKKNFPLAWTSLPTSNDQSSVSSAVSTTWLSLVTNFTVRGATVGYLNTSKFLNFLGQTRSANTPSTSQKNNLLWTILVLLLGGIALNLTPCVLPLIPINLAILGAGSKARTKGEGFVVGGLYGLAMALVYGFLGIFVVITGAKFGTLNASPWFNVGIAVIFAVLALAMFDIIHIDFSRWQGNFSQQRLAKQGHYALAFFMGIISALLAGACVAPVVISALLLAGNLYAQGVKLAILFPLLLGIGMGLPWPFAGAGLAVLPKPGAWMNWIKRAFGILILVAASYYGHLAYKLFNLQTINQSTSTNGDPAVASLKTLEVALQNSMETRRPIFIDFWATWCKNCLAMDATTFKDAGVKQALSSFIVVKFQAEFPNETPAKDVLDHFGAIGLPTYVVLAPR